MKKNYKSELKILIIKNSQTMLLDQISSNHAADLWQKLN